MIPILTVSNVISCIFNLVELSNVKFNSSEIILMKNVANVNIDSMKASFITGGNITFPITFVNSNVQIFNSLFFEIQTKIIIQTNNNLTIKNLTFKNLVLNDALIIFSFGQNLVVTQSYFYNLTSKITIFFVRSSNICIIQTISIRNSSFYSILFHK